MKAVIAEYLKNQIQPLGIFKDVHGLAEIITETKSDGSGTKSFPALYKGKDSLRYITNFDYHNGLGFFLCDSETQALGESKRYDSRYINYSATLSFYGIVKRTNESDLIQTIFSKMRIDNEKAARRAIGVNTISGYVARVVTGAELVLPNIFSGVEIKSVHDLSYIGIEFSVTASYYEKCLMSKCC